MDIGSRWYKKRLLPSPAYDYQSSPQPLPWPTCVSAGRKALWSPARDRRTARPAHRRAHRPALLALRRRQDLAGTGRADTGAGGRGLSRAAGDATRPAARRTGSGANRYVLSLLLGLEEGAARCRATASGRACRPDPGRLPGAIARDSRMATGTATCSSSTSSRRSSPDPTDREAKLAFFEQVGQALRDRNRWALFAMREEFVAGLDPYLRPIPTRFDKGRRYRLELLGPELRQRSHARACRRQSAGDLHRRSRRPAWWTTCAGRRCSSRTGRW